MEHNEMLIEQFPKDGDIYPDDFKYYPENGTYDWYYFNPDGDGGKGVFIYSRLSEEDVHNAHKEYIGESDPDEARNKYITYITTFARTEIISTDNDEFASYAEDYIHKPNDVDRFFGLSENNGNASEIDRFVRLNERRNKSIQADYDRTALLYLEDIDLRTAPDKEKYEFYLSSESNTRCAKAIAEAISKNYGTKSEYSLDTETALAEITERFAPERVAYVLAVAINDRGEFDKRITGKNTEWAKELLKNLPDRYTSVSNRNALTIRTQLGDTHSGLINLFTEDFIKENPHLKTLAEPHIPLAEQVMKRLQDELESFNAEMVTLDPTVILSRITEISTKRNIAEYDVVGNIELDSNRLSALLTSKNILDEVYQEWLSLDTNDIGQAFEECADGIMESLKREQENNAKENANNELEWKVIHDSDDENGRPTLWSAEINNIYGRFAWISRGPENGFNVEIMNGQGEFKVIESFGNLLEAEEFVEENLLTQTNKEENIHDKQYYFEQAKKYINDFCDKEYGSTGDFSNINEVGIGYTEITDEDIPLQINADLENYQIKYYLKDRLYKTEDYDSLQAMVENALSVLDFNELVYTVESDPDEIIQAFVDLDTNISVPEQGIRFDIAAVDEFVITGEYSDYLGGMDENGHEAKDNYQRFNTSFSLRLEGAKVISEIYDERDEWSPYTEDIFDLLADGGRDALIKHINDFANDNDVREIYTIKKGEKKPLELTEETSDSITLDGYPDTYSVINTMEYGGKTLSLLENDELGEDAPYIIIDSDKKVLSDRAHSFGDFTSVYTESEVALDLLAPDKTICFTVVELDDSTETLIFDGRYNMDDIQETNEYRDYCDDTIYDDIRVHLEQYMIGYGESSDTLTDAQIDYIKANLTAVKKDSSLLESDSQTLLPIYEEDLIENVIDTVNEMGIGNSLDLKEDVIENLGLQNKSIGFSVVTFDDDETFIMDSNPDEYDIYDTDEFKEYIERTGSKSVDVSCDYYILGDEGEADYATDEQKKYIYEHLDEAIAASDYMENDVFTVDVPVKEIEEDIEEKKDAILSAGFTIAEDNAFSDDGFTVIKNEKTGEEVGFDGIDLAYQHFMDDNDTFFHGENNTNSTNKEETIMQENGTTRNENAPSASFLAKYGSQSKGTNDPLKELAIKLNSEVFSKCEKIESKSTKPEFAGKMVSPYNAQYIPAQSTDKGTLAAKVTINDSINNVSVSLSIGGKNGENHYAEFTDWKKDVDGNARTSTNVAPFKQYIKNPSDSMSLIQSDEIRKAVVDFKKFNSPLYKLCVEANANFDKADKRISRAKDADPEKLVNNAYAVFSFNKSGNPEVTIRNHDDETIVSCFMDKNGNACTQMGS